MAKGQFVHTTILQSDICGIVDQNVNLAVFCLGVGKKLFNALGGGDVHEMVGGFSACLHDFINDSLSLLLSASADNDLCSLRGKQLGDADTDTTGRACNNSNLVF